MSEGMNTVKSLLRWAAVQGVKLDGIKPKATAEHGFGMVATRTLMEGDVVMTVPIDNIRSLHTVPGAVRGKLAEASIHGLLAADILSNPPEATHWGKLVPKLADFQEQLPYFWPEELQELLPTEAKSLLAKQQQMLHRDWEQFKIGFPDTHMQDYSYAWFLVGTRAFYYETPEMKSYPWHDRLALLPVADLFNHAATGCSVSYWPSKSYTITSDRQYFAGDEVYTSYGKHSNDYLLAEYGFVLPENPADLVCLDDIILPKLSDEQKALFDESGIVANFMLPCDRTKEALQQLRQIAPNIDVSLSSLLAEFLGRIDDTKQIIGTSEAGTNSQRALLVRRWNQIEAIVTKSIEELD